MSNSTIKPQGSEELVDKDSIVSSQEQLPPTDLLKKRFELIKDNAPQSKEQFYQQSFEIFSKLNDCVKGNDSTALKDSKRTEISHIVTEYVDLVHEYPETSKFAPIWDMSNLLYFSDNNLATSLNDWINEYCPMEEDEDSYAISVHHILRGNYIEAVDTLNGILSDLNESQVSAIKIIIHLIEKFQLLQENQTNKTTYVGEWNAWHEECETELNNFLRMGDEAGELTEDDQEIRAIFDVLFGDEEVIFYSGSYFERVLGSILYSRPAITMPGLAHIAQRVIDKGAGIDVCAYILMGCFDDAFEAYNDLWLQAHLGHALIAVGAKSIDHVDSDADSVEKESIIDPVYYCINEYATMLAEKKNMWKEAVVYITACVENREIWIKNLLSESPLKSKDLSLLRTVLNIANESNMSSVQKYIHQAIGQRYEEKKDIKQATIEYGKAQDLESLDRFAHAEFSQYLKTGKLGHVVTDMEELKASPHYAMLILYHNFRVYIEKKEWKKASKLLLELLKCDRLPTKFEIVLLIDNFVILQDPRDFYTGEEMLHLIEIFRAVTKESSNDDFFANYYQFVYHKALQGTVATAKLRELMSYRAAMISMDGMDLTDSMDESDETDDAN